MSKNYWFNYKKRLKQACQANNLFLQTITWTDKQKLYPIFKIVINQKNKQQKNIIISAGIHGDEISGPETIISWLKKPTAIPKQISLTIFPAINPWGVAHYSYTNKQKINLNQDFKQIKSREIKELIKDVKTNWPDIFLSLHEDDEKTTPYIYNYGANNKLARKIINEISLLTKVCLDKKIYQHSANQGVINLKKSDSSFEGWLYGKGLKNCLCLEVPDKLSIKNRIDINLSAIKILLK